MRAVDHAVPVECLPDCCDQRLARQTNIKSDRDRAFVEPVHVLVERYQRPVYETQTFPDAVAKHEAAVEHRYHGLIPGHEFAIDVNQDLVVTRVVNVTLCA